MNAGGQGLCILLGVLGLLPFWGQEFDLAAVGEEIRRITPLLQKAEAKARGITVEELEE